MQTLLQDLQTEARDQAILRSLYNGLRKRWETFGDDLLYCFDIPGLPQDNLMIESVFGRLRCQQRRISGRKSTQPLRDFGHVQILFLAESEAQLLEQIRDVSVEEYREQRSRQAQAEAPRKFLHRLHRNPAKTMRDLAEKFMAHLPVEWPFVVPVSEGLSQHTA
jgi:transposase InsO family protein